MTISRRELIKANAAAAAAAAAVIGMTLPASATDALGPGKEGQLKWSKAPCRFCGVAAASWWGRGTIASTPLKAISKPR